MDFGQSLFNNNLSGLFPLGFVLYGTYGFQNSAQDMAEKIPLLAPSSIKNGQHLPMNRMYGGVLEDHSREV